MLRDWLAGAETTKARDALQPAVAIGGRECREGATSLAPVPGASRLTAPGGARAPATIATQLPAMSASWPRTCHFWRRSEREANA
jgi:hypothetical protein